MISGTSNTHATCTPGNCLASAGDSGEVILWRPAATLPGAAVAQPSTPSTHRATAAATAATTPTSAVQHSEPGSRVDEAGTATPVAAPTAHEDSAALWRQAANLRGHHDDVTDICWSHDDAVLLTGSVENEAMMFDADRRGCLVRVRLNSSLQHSKAQQSTARFCCCSHSPCCVWLVAFPWPLATAAPLR